MCVGGGGGSRLGLYRGTKVPVSLLQEEWLVSQILRLGLYRSEHCRSGFKMSLATA